MAHDATFVAGIRQVRDDVLSLICDGNMLRSEINDQRWHQFDFEGHSCLECSQQPSGLLRIVEHQRTPSTIEPSDSAIANDREYGSTEPFSAELARTKPGKVLFSPDHVIDLEWMRKAYWLTRKDGATGIDGRSCRGLPPARADRNGQDDDAGAPDVGKNHDLADSSVPVMTTNHLTQQPHAKSQTSD